FFLLLVPLTEAILQQFQSQSLLTSPQFSFKTSQRSGRHLLVVNGVTFFRNRHRNNKQYWKCNQYYKCKCPCIVVIDEINSRMNVKHIHNHDIVGSAGPVPAFGGTYQPAIRTTAAAPTLLNQTMLASGSSTALLRSPTFAHSVQPRVYSNKRE
ncbi:uncharacterized protein LOC128093753, partial [Culex pipiens pallens]|uniref:uncharacterized protein LOC128093753 n=1 Tax=Culex pipiens pallens TaxID=42434 RepID=UPI0022AB1831